MPQTQHRVLEPNEMLFLIVLDQHNRGPAQSGSGLGPIREGLDPITYATIQLRLKPFVCNEVFLLEAGYCKRPAPDRTGRLITRAFAITTEGRAAIPRFLRLALGKSREQESQCRSDEERRIAQELSKRLEGWIGVYNPPELAPAPAESSAEEEAEEETEETAEDGPVPVPSRGGGTTMPPRRAPAQVRESKRPPTLAQIRERAAANPPKHKAGTHPRRA